MEAVVVAKLKVALGLILHGVFYGLGLAFAFWLIGKMTAHLDYYLFKLYREDQPRFWTEIQKEMYFPSILVPVAKMLAKGHPRASAASEGITTSKQEAQPIPQPS